MNVCNYCYHPPPPNTCCKLSGAYICVVNESNKAITIATYYINVQYPIYYILTKSLDHSHVKLLPLYDILELYAIEFL